MLQLFLVTVEVTIFLYFSTVSFELVSLKMCRICWRTNWMPVQYSTYCVPLKSREKREHSAARCAVRSAYWEGKWSRLFCRGMRMLSSRTAQFPPCASNSRQSRPPHPPRHYNECLINSSRRFLSSSLTVSSLYILQLNYFTYSIHLYKLNLFAQFV